MPRIIYQTEKGELVHKHDAVDLEIQTKIEELLREPEVRIRDEIYEVLFFEHAGGDLTVTVEKT